MKNFDYDKMTDSLFISRKGPGEKVQGSAEVGNLVIDFTGDGKIVNTEFRNISKFLEMMKFDQGILNDLTGASLMVQQQRGAVSIFALLKTPSLEQPIPLATLPMAQSLSP